MHIGKQLRLWVEARHRKSSEFCRKVEISPQLLNAYFGTPNIRLKTLQALADKLGLPFDEFMAGLRNAEVTDGSQADQA